MGYAERAAESIRQQTRPGPSQSRRLVGTQWDFIGEGRAWFCLGCGAQGNMLPEQDGSTSVICGCGNRAALAIPKEK